MDAKNEIALSYGLANFETILNPVCTWAVDAIGLEVGRRLSGFVEIGIGEQGLIPVGLRYRF